MYPRFYIQIDTRSFTLDDDVGFNAFFFYDFQKLSKSQTNVSKWWTPLNNCIPIITDFLKMSFDCDIHFSYCTILVKCYKLN